MVTERQKLPDELNERQSTLLWSGSEELETVKKIKRKLQHTSKSIQSESLQHHFYRPFQTQATLNKQILTVQPKDVTIDGEKNRETESYFSHGNVEKELSVNVDCKTSEVCDELVMFDPKKKPDEDKSHQGNDHNCGNSVHEKSDKKKVIKRKFLERDKTLKKKITIRKKVGNSSETNDAGVDLPKGKMTLSSRPHSLVKPYQCEQCGARFSQRGNLKSHNRVHTGERPFVCKICGKKFADQTNKTNHERSHVGDKRYVCDYCGRRFITNGVLKKHIRKHTGERPYRCDTCGKTFAQSDYLSVHKSSHKGEKPFACEVCGIRFTRNCSLLRHLKIHQGDKPYECDICTVKFSRRSNMNTHRKSHSKEKYVTNKNEETKSNVPKDLSSSLAKKTKVNNTETKHVKNSTSNNNDMNDLTSNSSDIISRSSKDPSYILSQKTKACRNRSKKIAKNVEKVSPVENIASPTTPISELPLSEASTATSASHTVSDSHSSSVQNSSTSNALDAVHTLHSQVILDSQQNTMDYSHHLSHLPKQADLLRYLRDLSVRNTDLRHLDLQAAQGFPHMFNRNFSHSPNQDISGQPTYLPCSTTTPSCSTSQFTPLPSLSENKDTPSRDTREFRMTKSPHYFQDTSVPFTSSIEPFIDPGSLSLSSGHLQNTHKCTDNPSKSSEYVPFRVPSTTSIDSIIDPVLLSQPWESLPSSSKIKACPPNLPECVSLRASSTTSLDSIIDPVLLSPPAESLSTAQKSKDIPTYFPEYVSFRAPPTSSIESAKDPVFLSTSEANNSSPSAFSKQNVPEYYAHKSSVIVTDSCDAASVQTSLWSNSGQYLSTYDNTIISTTKSCTVGGSSSNNRHELQDNEAISIAKQNQSDYPSQILNAASDSSNGKVLISHTSLTHQDYGTTPYSSRQYVSDYNLTANKSTKPFDNITSSSIVSKDHAVYSGTNSFFRHDFIDQWPGVSNSKQSLLGESNTHQDVRCDLTMLALAATSERGSEVINLNKSKLYTTTSSFNTEVTQSTNWSSQSNKTTDEEVRTVDHDALLDDIRINIAMGDTRSVESWNIIEDKKRLNNIMPKHHDLYCPKTGVSQDGYTFITQSSHNNVGYEDYLTKSSYTYDNGKENSRCDNAGPQKNMSSYQVSTFENNVTPAGVHGATTSSYENCNLQRNSAPQLLRTQFPSSSRQEIQNCQPEFVYQESYSSQHDMSQSGYTIGELPPGKDYIDMSESAGIDMTESAGIDMTESAGIDMTESAGGNVRQSFESSQLYGEPHSKSSMVVKEVIGVTSVRDTRLSSVQHMMTPQTVANHLANPLSTQKRTLASDVSGYYKEVNHPITSMQMSSFADTIVKKVKVANKAIYSVGRNYLKVQNLDMSDLKGKKYQCEFCGTRFTQKCNLTTHRRIHTGEKPYRCSDCNLCFSDYSNIVHHVAIHSGDRQFVCDFCGLKFVEKSALKKHQRIHTGEKPYHCSTCGKKFARSTSLSQHILIHKTEKSYKCDQCGAMFAQSSSMRRHKKTHTGERPFQCEICLNHFSRRNNLNIHKNRVHPEITVTYACDLCGEAVASENDLIEHRANCLLKPNTILNKGSNSQLPQTGYG